MILRTHAQHGESELAECLRVLSVLTSVRNVDDLPRIVRLPAGTTLEWDHYKRTISIKSFRTSTLLTFSGCVRPVTKRRTP